MNLQHKITELKGKKLSLSPHGHKQADMEERLCEDIQAGWKKKKKNSGLPSDVQSTQVAFNSVFINRLKQDLSLLVKRTKVEWETCLLQI